MGLHWKTTVSYPRLRTYADALKHYESVKPIRGDKQGLRPLGRRDQKYINIACDPGGDIVINHGHRFKHDNVIIRFRPNNDVLIYDVLQWNKASEHDIVGAVLGLHMETKDGRSWYKSDYLRPNPRSKWTGKEWERPDPSKFPQNVFRFDDVNKNGYPVWRFVNPPTLVTHVIRRPVMRQLRAHYSPALTYIEALYKLEREQVSIYRLAEVVGIQIDHTNIWEGRAKLLKEYPRWHGWSSDKFTHAHAAKLCGWLGSSDPADQYKAYAWLSHGENSDRRFSSQTMREFAEWVIIMHHHAEVLERRESQPAKPGKDRYAWAIPQK